MPVSTCSARLFCKLHDSCKTFFGLFVILDGHRPDGLPLLIGRCEVIKKQAILTKMTKNSVFVLSFASHKTLKDDKLWSMSYPEVND